MFLRWLGFHPGCWLVHKYSLAAALTVQDVLPRDLTICVWGVISQCYNHTLVFTCNNWGNYDLWMSLLISWQDNCLKNWVCLFPLRYNGYVEGGNCTDGYLVSFNVISNRMHWISGPALSCSMQSTGMQFYKNIACLYIAQLWKIFS